VKRSRSLRRALAAATGWLAAAVHAAHPLITEDTGTQGAGRWQLEANAEWARERPGHERFRSFLPAATLAYGFVESADLQFSIPWLREESAGERTHGSLDTAIELKWRFFEKGPWSLALMPGVILPTGRESPGFGAGRARWGSLLILSWEEERWAFHTHAGYLRNRNDHGERENLRHVSASVWLKPTSALKLVVDRSYDTSADPATRGTERQTIAGAIYSIGEDVDLDLGYRRGEADRAWLAGVTLRW
jgi:hypothetical protein